MANNTRKSKNTAKAAEQKTSHKSSAKSKKQACIDLLKRPKGASLAELQKATGWRSHSVRGFLSGTVKKMADITLVSEIVDGGTRRYRVEKCGEAKL